MALVLGGALVWARPTIPGTATLLLLGDTQVHQNRSDPKTAFAYLRSTLRKADLVYANLEGLLVPSAGEGNDIPDKAGWTHPGPTGLVALQDAHIGVVGLANNVAYGGSNLLRTLQLLDSGGVAHTGAGKDLTMAHRPAIVERGGVRFGFLQYTARWYRAPQQLATPTRPGVAALTSRDGLRVDPADLERVRQDIVQLRPRVDVLIVSEHNRDGATAVQFGPRRRRRDLSHYEPYQQQFAHLALEAGADLVYGHGTHCLQGVEVYRGKPILYAIGHSAFDQPGHESYREGLLVRVLVRQRKVLRVSFVPLTRDRHNDPYLLDSSRGEGARLVGVVQALSPGVRLRRQGAEEVLIGPTQIPSQEL